MADSSNLSTYWYLSSPNAIRNTAFLGNSSFPPDINCLLYHLLLKQVMMLGQKAQWIQGDHSEIKYDIQWRKIVQYHNPLWILFISEDMETYIFLPARSSLLLVRIVQIPLQWYQQDQGGMTSSQMHKIRN